ncbi:MAG: DUF1214 domain-containing protein [Actinobacteria bacterium]|nr:DUF1214 domain-containing protein [Actinomycetota bacterium]
MRPSTRTGQFQPAARYGRFVGRVGALALFLGVGTALGMPAASAEGDDSSRSGPASRSATSSSASSSPHSARGPSARPARATRGTAHRAATAPQSLASASRGAGITSWAKGAPKAPVASPASLAAAAYTRRPAAVTPRRQSAAVPIDAELAAEPAAGGLPTPVGAATPVSAVSAAQAELSNQVSPLGTPVQIARERVAMRTAASLPVTLMKFVLRQGFLAAGNQQFALVGGVDAANLQALDNAVDEYALASAFSQQILNPMDPAVVTQVAPPHSWYGLDVAGSRLLYDNPDTIYRFIPVNKTAEYVITGRLFEGIPSDTTFSVLEGTAGTTSTILTLDDLDISPDGSFVITVSGAAATPGQRNHLQLTSSSTLVAARNTLGDWAVEDPMGLEVQRVGGPPNSLFAQLGGFVLLGSLVNDNPLLASLASLIPPLGIAEAPIVRGTLTALLMIVRGSNQQAKYMALATTDPVTGQLRAPNVMTQPASNAEFLANQLQSNGYFQLAEDEALILTIDPASAGFFTVPVYNDWTITDDYWNQQTSLNNDQSIANLDGTFTIVVSPTDPLVANWLSTGGLNQGIISMRFQNLDPDSPDTPTVTSQVVKISDLGDYLPEGTVFVTPEQRATQLAVRKAGFDKRWAPYPQP